MKGILEGSKGEKTGEKRKGRQVIEGSKVKRKKGKRKRKRQKGRNGGRKEKRKKERDLKRK